MSEIQVIKGISFPKFVGPYAVYLYDAQREDGTAHESKRICVKVRRKAGEVRLIAMEGNNVRGEYVVKMPLVGSDRIKCISAATRFSFELNQALKNAAEAHVQEF